jgi:hypothetical protein
VQDQSSFGTVWLLAWEENRSRDRRRQCRTPVCSTISVSIVTPEHSRTPDMASPTAGTDAPLRYAGPVSREPRPELHGGKRPKQSHNLPYARRQAVPMAGISKPHRTRSESRILLMTSNAPPTPMRSDGGDGSGRASTPVGERAFVPAEQHRGQRESEGMAAQRLPPHGPP